MKVYYLNKHLMYEHYQDNFPVGFRVVKEKKGVVRHTVLSCTAMPFLLGGTLHMEGKRFPDFTVHGSQMSPMPTSVDDSIRFTEDSLVLVLYFIDSKFKFYHNIITDKMTENAPKCVDWSFVLGVIKPVVVLARQTADYVMDGLLCCDIQLSKQREFVVVMQVYCSKDDLTPFLAPLYGMDLSSQDTIIAMPYAYPFIDETAEKVYASHPTFIYHSKQCSGETPRAWISKVKDGVLFKALLNTSDTLEQIVNQLKFSSVQCLSIFRKETFDDAPSEIRNGTVRPEQAL